MTSVLLIVFVVIGLISISVSHHNAYIISTLFHGEGEETQIKVKG